MCKIVTKLFVNLTSVKQLLIIIYIDYSNCNYQGIMKYTRIIIILIILWFRIILFDYLEFDEFSF